MYGCGWEGVYLENVIIVDNLMIVFGNGKLKGIIV